MEAVFWPEVFWIFSSDFPAVLREKAHENGWKSPEKIRRLFDRNTASMFH
jgi:hypothetical protein